MSLYETGDDMSRSTFLQMLFMMDHDQLAEILGAANVSEETLGVTDTSPDGSITLSVKNPIRSAGVGQIWTLLYEVETKSGNYKIACESSKKDLVTWDIYLIHRQIKLIINGDAIFRVTATHENGSIAEVSFPIKTILQND
jgi:hypothetical protein